MILNDRTYVPCGLIEESMGVNIDRDESANIVRVVSEGSDVND